MHLLMTLPLSPSECLVSWSPNLLYLGNKSDKEDERQVTSEEEEKWCEKNQIKDHFTTSAKTATNVQEAFESMVKKALAREKKNKHTMPGTLSKGPGASGTVKLNPKKKNLKAKSACEC
jgi:GTPase SAR1 family protein